MASAMFSQSQCYACVLYASAKLVSGIVRARPLSAREWHLSFRQHLSFRHLRVGGTWVAPFVHPDSLRNHLRLTVPFVGGTFRSPDDVNVELSHVQLIAAGLSHWLATIACYLSVVVAFHPRFVYIETLRRLSPNI
jgi:hypothetical protein